MAKFPAVARRAGVAAAPTGFPDESSAVVAGLLVRAAVDGALGSLLVELAPAVVRVGSEVVVVCLA
ncbi:MAG: hypothetical protein M3396_01100 [Actinomycetota bacterium]|nr:hypothetical protein [Actinomycetota bacterium]